MHDQPCAVAADAADGLTSGHEYSTLLALTTRSTRQVKTRWYAIICTRHPSIEFFLPATPSANCRETHSAFGNGRLSCPSSSSRRPCHAAVSHAISRSKSMCSSGQCPYDDCPCDHHAIPHLTCNSNTTCTAISNDISRAGLLPRATA